MAWARAGIMAGVVALALVALSGGQRGDPRTPAGLPGLPQPLLGVAVVGGGGRTAAVDAYGNVVDLRAHGPAGRALVAVSSERWAAGTVSLDEAIVARMTLPGGRKLPLWRADSVRQRYLPGTNVLRTVARFGDRRAVVVRRIGGPGAVRADRRWLARARPLGPGAPGWARALYRRSLLVLRALTDRSSGAIAAGARDGWAYVWPRDAAAVAIAFASAGYRPEAQRIVGFLQRLDLSAAARFRGAGQPVPGREAQGDAAGWVTAAARAAGLPAQREQGAWRGRADYQEGDGGEYLGNAIAAGLDPARIRGLFAAPRGLTGSLATLAPASTRPLPGRYDPSPGRPSSPLPVAPCCSLRPDGSAALDSFPQSAGMAATIPGRRRRPGSPGPSPPWASAASRSG